MKDKIINRLKENYTSLLSLSKQVEDSMKNIKPDLSKSEKINIGIPFEALKSCLTQFFLLIEIVEKDLETPIASFSEEISNYRDTLLGILDKSKDPKVAEELKKMLNKT